MSRRGLPPKKNARTMIIMTRVRGKASMGDENHRRMSSIATTPRAIYAQVGIDAEYVYFLIILKLHFF